MLKPQDGKGTENLCLFCFFTLMYRSGTLCWGFLTIYWTLLFVSVSTGVPTFTDPAADATGPAERFRTHETTGAASRRPPGGSAGSLAVTSPGLSLVTGSSLAQPPVSKASASPGLGRRAARAALPTR